MAKDSILGELKVVIYDMVDSYGDITDLPRGTTGKRNLTNNRVKLLTDIIILLRDTKIITEATRYYVFNRYMTIKDANEAVHYNKTKEEIDKQFNNSLSKIQYDKKKLSEALGKRIIIDILYNNTDISEYEKLVAEQYMKYSTRNGLRDNLGIEIPNNCITSEIDDESFNEFISIIAPYSKSQMAFIESNLDSNACGYFNYILSMPNLGSKDRERLDRLKLILNNNDGVDG